MSMITIGGTAIKEPSSFEINISDIVDLQLNLAGTVNADITALGKRTLTIGYNIMTATELSTLLTLLKANYFMTVIYVDPETNASKTISARVGDRSSTIYTFQSIKKIYRDIKFELIER